MDETDRGPGDGHWPLSEPKATQIISGEYYKSRQGDLAWIASVCQIPDMFEGANASAISSEELILTRGNDRLASRGLFLLRRPSLEEQSRTAKNRNGQLSS